MARLYKAKDHSSVIPYTPLAPQTVLVSFKVTRFDKAAEVTMTICPLNLRDKQSPTMIFRG